MTVYPIGRPHGAAIAPPQPDRRRLQAAEAVATAALQLVTKWAAWSAMQAAELAGEAGHDATATHRELVAELTAEPDAAMQAVAAFEALDAAVRAWSPLAYGGG